MMHNDVGLDLLIEHLLRHAPKRKCKKDGKINHMHVPPETLQEYAQRMARNDIAVNMENSYKGELNE